jgi:hypothetical protein
MTKEKWCVVKTVNTIKQAERELEKQRASGFEGKIKELPTKTGYFIVVKLPEDIDTNFKYFLHPLRYRYDPEKGK